MIALDNVSVGAGAFRLDGVSLSLERGEYAVLMGRTGCGKTSLLEAICGLRNVIAGRILCHGVDVTGWDPADRQIGYVPQDLALFPTLSVREHLEFALRVRRTSAAQRQTRVAELAELLGIAPLLERGVQALSGGEAQRVALGRALAFQPALLLLDEPLSALDEATRGDMYDLLRRLKERTQVTTLHVTHNHDEADALADRLFVLDDGRLSEAQLPR